METQAAFAMGEANKDKDLMVFDWIKATKIIKEKKAQKASAGLANDWEWTGGTILKNGIPINKKDSCTFLASTWAKPELEIRNRLNNSPRDKNFLLRGCSLCTGLYMSNEF